MRKVRLSRGGAYLASLALGSLAFFWLPVSFVIACETLGAYDGKRVILFALPGLFPAWGAWALFDWARRIEAEAAFNAPIAPPALVPTGTAQGETPSGTPLTVVLCAVIILGSVALQTAVVLLAVVSNLLGYGANAGGLLFLLFALSPCVVGGLLACSLLRRGRGPWLGTGLEGSARLARSALLWVAVGLVLAEVMWSSVNIVLWMAVTWGPLDLNLLGLAVLVGPSLILLAIARRTTSAAFEMIPIR